MVKTHAQKTKAREERLAKLPRSERLAKSAQIKKKEGRVLDASEKHALKMTTEYGEILRLWEHLRTLPSPNEAIAAKQSAAELKKAARRAQRKEDKKKSGSKRTVLDDAADDDDENDTPAAVASPAVAKSSDAAAPGERRETDRHEHKHPTVDTLFEIIGPKFANLVKTPRVSRVLQSMIKFGSNKHLDKMLSHLSKDFATYCTDSFANFVVSALIRHAPHALYRKILLLIVPAMPVIVTHKFGIRVVHAAYSSRLCNSLDRNLVVLGVFKDSVALMKGWKGFPVLEDILAQEMDHRKRLLTRLFDLCDKLVSQKESFEYPFVQRLVFAYLQNGINHEISELCVSLKKYVVPYCEAKEGSILASVTFGLLQPSDRKELLRGFSEKMIPLACGKYTAPTVARLFDLVYDTQLLFKYVASQLTEHLNEVIESPYGYLILIHLLTPDAARKEKHFLPNWAEHNHYSRSNKKWNQYDWLDSEFKKETIEICPKDASKTHLAVLGPIVAKFLSIASSLANKHHVSMINQELLHLHEQEPAYAKVLALTNEQVAELRETISNKEKRQRDEAPQRAEYNPNTVKTKNPATEEKALKIRRTETPVKSATTPVKVTSPVAAPAPSGEKSLKKSKIEASAAKASASPATSRPPFIVANPFASTPVRAKSASGKTPEAVAAESSVIFTPVPGKPSTPVAARAAATPSAAPAASAQKKRKDGSVMLIPSPASTKSPATAAAVSPVPRREPSAVLLPDDDDAPPMEVSARVQVSSSRKTATPSKVIATPKSAALNRSGATPSSLSGAKRPRTPEFL